MKTKKGDFVDITFVARLDDGRVFDLNDLETAKKEKLNTKGLEKTIVCLGERDLVPGLDDFLIDKEVGEELKTEISPDQAFGRKQADLIQMIPLRKFKEHNINPVPGLQINIDGMLGIVKSVSGGRIMIDFNHPLASRNLFYEVKVNRIVTELKEKLESFLKQSLKMEDPKYEIKGEELDLNLPIPEQLQKGLEEEIKKRFSEIKSVKFSK